MSLRDRRLEIGLARAALDAGSLSGDLTVTDLPTAPGADVAAQLRATDVNVADTAPFLGLPKTLAGNGHRRRRRDRARRRPRLARRVARRNGRASCRRRCRSAFRPRGDGCRGERCVRARARRRLRPDTGAVRRVGLSFLDGVGTIERASVVTPSYSASAEGWIGLLDGGLEPERHAQARRARGGRPVRRRLSRSKARWRTPWRSGRRSRTSWLRGSCVERAHPARRSSRARRRASRARSGWCRRR